MRLALTDGGRRLVLPLPDGSETSYVLLAGEFVRADVAMRMIASDFGPENRYPQ